MLTGKRLLRFEGCEVDPGARLLKRDGTTIPLNPKTFDLLLYLVEHPQQVISKEELLAAVWPGAFVEESNLTQHIFLLRRALYGTQLNGRTVVTVPGKGYQFAAAVERVEPDSRPAGELVLHSVQSVTRVVVEEESDDETPAQAALPGRSGGRRRVLWAVVAGLIAVAGAGGWLEWKRLNPAPAGHMDLVLADFENTTGDSTLDRPLNQALLIDLEQSPFLNLLSRSRVQETLTEMERGKGEALTSSLAMEVCQRTNAQAMLHGSLAKVGARYLLILDADNCASGKPIAGYKTEVDSQGEVLHALDTGAGRIRRDWENRWIRWSATRFRSRRRRRRRLTRCGLSPRLGRVFAMET